MARINDDMFYDIKRARVALYVKVESHENAVSSRPSRIAGPLTFDCSPTLALALETTTVIGYTSNPQQHHP